MKHLFIAMAIVGAGCSGSPAQPSATQPTSTEAQRAASAIEPRADAPAQPVPGGPTATAPTARATVAGPIGCVTAGTDLMRWVLEMADAGPSNVHFVALAHSDGQPGCEATNANPRSRVEIGGVLDYPAHSSGQTVFSFDPRNYSCGRVQIDVSLLDDAGERLLVGMMVNYGSACEPLPQPPPPPPPLPPPPPALSCAPATQTVAIGQIVNVAASGDTGPYAWAAPGGSTPTGTGAAFSTMYALAGTNTITVTSGAQTATCSVMVPPPVPALGCAPPTQTVGIGLPAVVAATGGTGTYAWAAPGGSTPTGTGAA
ncbi:MAG: hypothetical protein ABI868_24775, partial [Acidobacteriota bacterium]